MSSPPPSVHPNAVSTVAHSAAPLLPTELLSQIVQELFTGRRENTQALLNCCRCNRLLQHEAERVLYSSFAMRYDSTLQPFLDAISRQPHRAKWIHGLYFLTIDGTDQQNADVQRLLRSAENLKELHLGLFSFSPEQISQFTFSLDTFATSWADATSICAILTSQPTIRTIHLQHESIDIRSILRDPLVLPNLQLMSGGYAQVLDAVASGRPIRRIDLPYNVWGGGAEPNVALVSARSSIPIVGLSASIELELGGTQLARIGKALPDLTYLKLTDTDVTPDGIVSALKRPVSLTTDVLLPEQRNTATWTPHLVNFPNLSTLCYALCVNMEDIWWAQPLAAAFAEQCARFCPSLQHVMVHIETGSRWNDYAMKAFDCHRRDGKWNLREVSSVYEN